MKVTLQQGTTIQIDGDADNATITETDDIMLQISDLLHRDLLAGKVGGCWYIRDANAQAPLYGHRGERTRKFTKALAGALNRTVVTKVPLRTKGMM
jgi:hypothetical protein